MNELPEIKGISPEIARKVGNSLVFEQIQFQGRLATPASMLPI
jgi:hypothetical protein